MTVGSDEVPVSPIANLEDSLIGFMGCIGSALPDICSYSITIGDSYVPFDPDDGDCDDEDDDPCSQAWVRVVQITPKQDPNSEGWGGDCALILEMELEVGVLRCIEVPEGGEAPTATAVLLAAFQSLTDMNAIKNAALACEVWDSIETGSWQPMGPLGGQYGGAWNFTVELEGDCVTDSGSPVGRVCGMWVGEGPPPDEIEGALNGDEYVDLVSGNVYTLVL